MLKLIKNGEIYSPKYLGKKDLLVAGDKIVYIGNNITLPEGGVPVDIIDASEKLVVPGFIDSHVHILGGGGEGGFKTRTPEIQLTDITRGGVTTVVGCLGTDGISRSMISLLAKARGLEEEGITTYIYTGSYQVPVRTITGKIEDDIVIIDKIIGVGEIAISDHRSSQPSAEDIAKIAASSRVSGMLSGKAGVVNIHMGDGKKMIRFLEEIAETTEIPITQFIPTHMNRNLELFEKALEYAQIGGIVDFTTSTIPLFLEEGETKCSKALKIAIDKNINIDNITFSSDGQGSLPVFNEKGEYVGLQVGKVTSLYNEVKDSILDENINIEDALKVITSNPARILKLNKKGCLKEGNDADIVILNKNDLNIDTVVAMGKLMIYKGEIKIRGTFES